MGLYSSGELPDTTSGIPNVSQFGWTPLEYDKVQQIIDYVDEVRGYRDEVIKLLEEGKILVEYVNNTMVDFNNKVIEIRDIYNKTLIAYELIKKEAATVTGYYNEVKNMYGEVSGIYIDILEKYRLILEAHADITVRHSDIIKLHGETQQSAKEAKDSEVQAQHFFEETYNIYTELKKGLVYRGTWNPNSGVYPDPNGTNSTWDVVLNPNQDEVDYDSKKWYWGDRLLFLTDGSIYQQIEAGSVVKSVNGKTGAVVLTLEELDGVKKTGDTMSGALTINHGTGLIISNSAYPGIRLTATNNDAEFRNKQIEVSTKGSLDFITRDASNAINGIVTLAAGKSGEIYHTGNKPTPGELGVYTPAEVDSKISDYTFSKTEINTKLSAKSDKTYTDSMLNQKVDKLTSVNGKPLSSSITLSATDVNAVNKSGDTMTGTLKVPSVTVTGSGKGISNSKELNLIRQGGSGDSDTVVGNPGGILYFEASNNTLVARDNGDDKYIYHQGFKPTASDVGAVDQTSDANYFNILSGQNSGRTKEVRIYSKDNNLYTVSQDGTVAKFYNDKSYKPTLADFGGLGVEYGNELNIPSNKPDFYFGFRKNGTEISAYHFANGKNQLGQYADITAKEFYAQGGKRVYHEAFKPTASDIGAVSKTGDTMTGPLHIQANSSHINLRELDSGNKEWRIEGYNGDLAVTETGVSQRMTIKAGGGVEISGDVKAGGDLYARGHKAYTAGNKPTAADVGALPANGKTVDSTYDNSLTLAGSAPTLSFSESDFSNKKYHFIADAGSFRLGEDSSVGKRVFSWETFGGSKADRVFSTDGYLRLKGRVSQYLGQSGWNITAVGDDNMSIGTIARPSDSDQHSGIGVHSNGNIYIWNNKSSLGYAAVFTQSTISLERLTTATKGLTVRAGAEGLVIQDDIGRLRGKKMDGSASWYVGKGNATDLLLYSNELNSGVKITGGAQGLLYNDYKVYHQGYKPAAADIGSGQWSNTSAYTGTSNQAQVFHDCRGTSGQDACLRSMREATSATWAWEKINNGSLKYSTGTNMGGSTKIQLNIPAGEGLATAGWKTGSDINFKENISYTDNVKTMNSESWLDKVSKLRSATFTYKDSPENKCLGFIAQDVQDVIPEAVSERDIGDLGAPVNRLFLDSLSIIAAQNEAIKELRQMVLELQEKIK